MMTLGTSAHRTSLLLLCASTLLGGCGQSVDSGAPSPLTQSDSGDDSPTRVSLVYGSSSADVELTTLPTQDYKGQGVVPLTAVWSAGGLAEATALEFDFEGADGFHPSSKPKCAAPITSEQLTHGYILPTGRTLVWDDSLGLPGCYSAHDVVKIIGSDATGR